MLRRQGLIETWHDRKIIAGQHLGNEISAALEAADVILFLVSSDFLASEYCYDIEMQRAMKRHEQGECTVIPLILRPCDWRDAPFGQLLAAPRDGRPVSRWEDRDDALLDIARAVRRAVESPHASSPFPRHDDPVDAAPEETRPTAVDDVQLLGRDHEAGCIADIIEEAASPQSGSPGVRYILIGGESGVGKSALARYACAYAAKRGFDVHSVVCEPFHEGMSLFPMRELARELSGSLSMTERIGQYHGQGSPQALTAQSAEDSAADPASRRDALIASFVNLILGRFRAQGQSRPLLLFIDDLECIDPGTVDALLCLLARAREGSAVVIGGFRTDIVREGSGSTHPLTRLLSAVRRQGKQGSVLQLGVLPAAALPRLCAIILGGECKFPREFYRRLYSETEGNPLFIREVIHSLASPAPAHGEPFLREVNGLWRLARPIDEWQLPPTIEDAIRLRLASLDSVQREELERAAVIGSRFAFEIISRLSSSSESELVDRLEAFISLDLIREIAGQPDIFAFSHGKIREVLYSSMSSLRRRRMHSEVANILRDLEPALGQDWAAMIGEHLFHAGAFEEACPLLLRAAREAFRLFSVSDAARQFEKALIAASKSALPIGEEEGRIQLERAECLKLAIEHEQARDLLMALKDHKDQDVRGWALNSLGDIHLTHGDVPAARLFYDQAEALARQLDDNPLLLEVASNLASLFNREAEHLAAIDPQGAAEADRIYNQYLDLELALVREHGNPAAVGRALRNEAKRLRVAGQFPEALAKYEAAVATEPPGTASHRLMIPYAKTLILAGAYDRALDVIRKVLAWSQQIGARRSEGIARQYLGVALWEQAMFAAGPGQERERLRDSSRTELEEALEIHEEVGFSNGRRETLIALGVWLLGLEDLAGAVQSFASAVGSGLDQPLLLKAVVAELQSNGDKRRAAYVESFVPRPISQNGAGDAACI
jgi:tetratricopeptide (TPR) repeat protein